MAPEPLSFPERGRGWLFVGFAFAASYALLRHYQFQSPFLQGYDGYYHIKYAWLLGERGFLREFPWAVHSIWADGFADKELLYHYLLVPFTAFGDLARGMKEATVLLGSLALTSFYAVLRLNRIRWPAIWFLLLLAAGAWFLGRVAAPRPHVLSILLLLWAVHFILNDRRLALATLCAVYAWSYTGHPIVPVLACVVGAGRWAIERRPEWRTPLAAFAGVAAGTLVNPYFPDNVRILWLQNVVVPWMAVQTGVDLGMAREFLPIGLWASLGMHSAVAVPAAAAVVLTLVRRPRLERRTIDLLLIAIVLVGMTLRMQRFVEYSAPMVLFLSGALFTDSLRGFDPVAAWRAGGAARRRVAVAAILVTALLALFHVRTYRDTAARFRPYAPRFEQAAAYVAANTRQDEVVFTCDWDDTPELFFFDHRRRYLVFLDPNFMYFHDADYWQRWRDVADGRAGGRSWNLLASEFRYGICTQDYARLRWIVERDPRLSIVLDSPGAYVFRVNREPSAIPLDLFLTLNDGSDEDEAR